MLLKNSYGSPFANKALRQDRTSLGKGWENTVNLSQ
jgi:hypothetical protein